MISNFTMFDERSFANDLLQRMTLRETTEDVEPESTWLDQAAHESFRLLNHTCTHLTLAYTSMSGLHRYIQAEPRSQLSCDIDILLAGTSFSRETIILNASRRFQSLQVLDISISGEVWLRVAAFIEARRATWQANRRAVTFAPTPLVPYEIQYNPQVLNNPADQHIYVHLNKFRGRGVLKNVTDSLLYTADTPTLVARAVCDASTRSLWAGFFAAREMDFLQELANCPGTAETYCLSETPPTGGGFRKRFEIIKKLYPLTLATLSQNTSDCIHLAEVDKDQIALQLVKALAHLHERGIAHGDLHMGQALIEKLSNGEFHAVLNDFNCSRRLDEKPILRSLRSRFYTFARGFQLPTPATGAGWIWNSANDQACLRRLEQEIAQDTLPTALRERRSAVCEDMLGMAQILSMIYFSDTTSCARFDGTVIKLGTLSAEQERYAIQDRLARRGITLDILPFREQIIYTILCMSSFASAAVMTCVEAAQVIQNRIARREEESSIPA